MGKFLTGIIFIIIGSLFYYLSTSYSLGSLTAIGPGYFPMLISASLILVGIAIVIKESIWT